ncbi:hypothetical protein [Bacillus mycoides]
MENQSWGTPKLRGSGMVKWQPPVCRNNTKLLEKYLVIEWSGICT